MTTSALAASTAPDPFWRRLRVVAMWSVMLGVTIELVLIGIAAASGKAPDTAQAVAQIASKVSWSFVVCAGVSCGITLTSRQPRAMGMLGMLSGPAAFLIARSVHKSALQALSDTSPAADAVSPALTALLRAIEYGTFGLWLGVILRNSFAPLRRYLLAALVIAVVFGSVFLWLFVRARPEVGMADLVPKVLNEFFFPVGCAAVLYVARKVSATALVE